VLHTGLHCGGAVQGQAAEGRGGAGDVGERAAGGGGRALGPRVVVLVHALRLHLRQLVLGRGDGGLARSLCGHTAPWRTPCLEREGEKEGTAPQKAI